MERVKMNEHVRDEIAAAWLLREHNGLNASEKLELDTWLADDKKNYLAYTQMQEVWEVLETLPDAKRPRLACPLPSNRPTYIPHLKHLIAGLFLMLGISAGGVYQYGEQQPIFTQIYQTQKGEILSTTLPDHSTITLDTQSIVEVRLYKNRRDVTLVEGQALFHVSKDEKRPFSVVADQSIVRVVGTTFVVAKHPDDVTVTVQEGRVQVGKMQWFMPDFFATLRAHESIVYTPHQERFKIQKLTNPSFAPWAVGRFEFDNITLQEALNNFSRYGDVPLFISDSTVKKLRLSGSFEIKKVNSFAQALPKILPVELVKEAEKTHIVGRL